jgi:hypothetical protein
LHLYASRHSALDAACLLFHHAGKIRAPISPLGDTGFAYRVAATEAGPTPRINSPVSLPSSHASWQLPTAGTSGNSSRASPIGWSECGESNTVKRAPKARGQPMTHARIDLVRMTGLAPVASAVRGRPSATDLHPGCGGPGRTCTDGFNALQAPAFAALPRVRNGVS